MDLTTRSSQDTVYETSGLDLRMAADGSIGAITSGGKCLPLLELAGGFQIAEYGGAEQGARVLEPVFEYTDSGIRLSCDASKLTLSVGIEGAEGYLEFHGELKDASAEGRLVDAGCNEGRQIFLVDTADGHQR